MINDFDSAVFDSAVAVVLEHEGSNYVSIPADRGGPTKFGITKDALKEAGLPDSNADVMALTKDQAKNIYKTLYWIPMGLAEVSSSSMAMIILDQAVLAGQGTVALVLQRLLGTKQDRIMGPMTIAALNRQSNNAPEFCFSFLRAMSHHYTAICEADSSQVVFFEGWLDRIWSLLHRLCF